MSRIDDLIPGGCHTYSKGRNSYPANAPAKLVGGKGGLVWDERGRTFVDFSMGINNVLIGHAEPAIDDAAIEAIRNGQAFGRPTLLEEQAAEAVLALFPQADMIKFAKNGSDANNAAIRLARAITGRQHIAYDETAPFFSTADWFCHSRPKWKGTLDAERAFVLPFRFNDMASLVRAFDTRRLACVILELCRAERPTREFLWTLTSLCDVHGTLLIVDEVVTGYRYGKNGVAPLFDIEPDLFTLGKGMSNGYSVSALLGKREYMKHGAIDGDVFLLSTTNGAEQSGLAAAIATAAMYQLEDIPQRLDAVGRELAGLVQEAAAQAGLIGQIEIRTAFGCRPMLEMPDHWREPFHAELIDCGVLWPKTWCCPCYRRTSEEMEQTFEALKSACRVVAQLEEAA